MFRKRSSRAGLTSRWFNRPCSSRSAFSLSCVCTPLRYSLCSRLTRSSTGRNSCRSSLNRNSVTSPPETPPNRLDRWSLTDGGSLHPLELGRNSAMTPWPIATIRRCQGGSSRAADWACFVRELLYEQTHRKIDAQRRSARAEGRARRKQDPDRPAGGLKSSELPVGFLNCVAGSDLRCLGLLMAFMPPAGTR